METSIIETTKGLQSAEEAQEYIKKVNYLLSELTKLSSDDVIWVDVLWKAPGVWSGDKYPTQSEG